MSRLKEMLCGSGAHSVMAEMDVVELIEKGAFILDVRTKAEVKKGMAPGAISIPLLRLKRHLDELPRDRVILTYCGTGERAGKAKDILDAAGFSVGNGGSYEAISKLLPSVAGHIAQIP